MMGCLNNNLVFNLRYCGINTLNFRRILNLPRIGGNSFPQKKNQDK